jgi:hypothetical protein
MTSISIIVSRQVDQTVFILVQPAPSLTDNTYLSKSELSSTSYFRKLSKLIEAIWEQNAEKNIWTTEKVIAEQRKWRSEERHNLHLSPNIIRVVKSKEMRQARQVARMKEMRNSNRSPQNNVWSRITMGSYGGLLWVQ